MARGLESGEEPQKDYTNLVIFMSKELSTDTLANFLGLCDSVEEPSDISSHLRALWFDRRGDWDSAHEEIQDDNDSLSAAIHAYLHRKEGDISNARYWYSTAGRAVYKGSLEEEWLSLAREATSRL